MSTIIEVVSNFVGIIENGVFFIVNKLASYNIFGMNLMYIIIIFVFMGSICEFVLYLITPVGSDNE